MSPARIPVAAGMHPPRVCLRHGRPARTMTPMVFLSRPPVWAVLLLIVAGRLVYHLAGKRVRKAVAVPAWPRCGRCDLTRLGGSALGAALIVAGLFTAVRLGDAVHGYAALAVLAGTLTVMVIGLVLLARSTRSATCGVRVSRDGEWLELHRPHEHFLAALRAQPAPEYPMPQGWTVPAASAPSTIWSEPAPTPTPAPESAPAGASVPAGVPDVPAHGWASPSQ